MRSTVIGWVERHRRILRNCVLYVVISVTSLTLAGCPPPPSSGIGGTVSIAPGLVVTVEEVRFPEDGRPEVVFRLSDSKGNPVALNELTDARFILAYLESPPTGCTARFVSYTTITEDPDRVPNSGDEAVQAAYDSARLNGITDNEDGTYTYKFAAAIPANFDPTATHQLGGQFQRLFVVDGQVYKYNLVHAFRPDGRAVTARREIVSTEVCNTCHTRLSVHGDVRREVQLCILCHNGQSADANSGNSVDFATMIHKIHRGENLPSVEGGTPYQIVGFGGRVFDFSTVAFPQDIRNCTVCHRDAPQADVYKTMPTIEGCAACHDRTWFGNRDLTPPNYTNHTGGMHADNRLCVQCHTPTSPGVSPIVEAHYVPTKSPAAPGLSFDILNVFSEPAGKGEGPEARVTIEFTARSGDGSPVLDLADLNAAAATIAWPVPEYEAWVREAIRGGGGPVGTLVNNGDGTYEYTFAATFPADTGETFAVAMEGRRTFEFRGAMVNQGTSSSGQRLFTLDGSVPAIRRHVVDEAKCNVCHEEIRAHGALRVGVNYCLMCHNPNTTDAARRPMDALPPQTVNFKNLIHSIHRGEDLESEFTVFGFGNVPHDYTEVRFPGLLQDCSICHASGTTDLPLPPEALSTLITDPGNGAIVREWLAERASCVSCHDGVLPNAHALLATDLEARVETCAVCHGPDSAFAVALVHRPAP